MAPPLTDMTVVDLTRVLAGPYCTMLLGDMGAEVIKIERPDGGDDTRGFGPPYLNGESAMFLAINRNKKSLTLNLKHPDAKQVLTRLIGRADVLVENFRPGTMANLGFDYATVSRLNPRIIYCSISGFGLTGPYASRGGYDTIAQAMSGIMSATGHPDMPPAKAGVPIADIGSGMFAAFGIVCAYVARQRTGQGQLVDTSLLDTSIALSAVESATFLAGGELPSPLGSTHRRNAPHGAFRVKDGYIAIAADSAHFWTRFCHILGLEALLDDRRFKTNADRVANKHLLQEIIEQVTVTRECRYWLEKLDAADIPCGPVNTYAEVFQDPHVQAREMLIEVWHPVAGPVQMAGINVKLSRTPGEVRLPAPTLGQHTAEILQTLGYNAQDIDNLKAAGAI
ncbi:MAG TPA: CoA transferase [Alphaproteobacteria bacterium]|nr:CoA transferase [Alphaproteobacteria bacterium]